MNAPYPSPYPSPNPSPYPIPPICLSQGGLWGALHPYDQYVSKKFTG